MYKPVLTYSLHFDEQHQLIIFYQQNPEKNLVSQVQHQWWLYKDQQYYYNDFLSDKIILLEG